jgi:EAL domain-containing protein (putative c-di-GMP-specific phosphodiesterase class I)
LAKSLNIKVIAEGVEEHDCLDILAEMEADYFQGFYLSKPIPESQVKNFLSHHLPEGYKGKVRSK